MNCARWSVVTQTFFEPMAITKQAKETVVQSLQDKFGRAKAVVFTNFEGLSVHEVNEMRHVLREAGIEYAVAKKTLIGLALKKAELDPEAVQALTGGLGVAFGYGDEILPAKTLDTFAKKHKALKLVGGFFSGAFIDAKQVVALAKLPSKEELLSKVVWLFSYPATGLVNVLAGNLRNLVGVLKAIQEKKPAV